MSPILAALAENILTPLLVAGIGATASVLAVLKGRRENTSQHYTNLQALLDIQENVGEVKAEVAATRRDLADHVRDHDQDRHRVL